MQDDLEAFLKRATQQRRDQRQPMPPSRIIEAEIIDEGLVELVEDDIVPIESVTESVSSHVQDHINTGRTAQRLSQLGARVEGADEKLESHLHQVFDHTLGQLGQSSVTDDAYEDSETLDPYATVAPVDAATKARDDDVLARELIQMLRDPRSLKQAVLLSEILSRPEDRW